jgi:HAMP domain-containing protein
MVIASTVVTVVIVVAVVAVIAVAFMALGPLSRTEQLRDDVEANTVAGHGALSEHTEEEIREDEGIRGGDWEERLDQENE